MFLEKDNMKSTFYNTNRLSKRENVKNIYDPLNEIHDCLRACLS